MKQVLIGIVSVMVCGATELVAAQPTPRVKAERLGGEPVLSLRSGDLTVTQTIARDVVQLRLRDTSDIVFISADSVGNVSVGRGNKSLSVSARSSSTREQAAVRDMLAGSSAWRSFDALMRSAWGSSSRSSRAFQPGHSMIWLLHGDYRPLLSFAAGVAAPPPILRLVRQDCDSAYAGRLGEIYNELVSCLDTWNPLQTAWCAYEYNFKVTWAMFEYVDCLI